MTTIIIDRAVIEQALEALKMVKINGKAGLLPAEIEEIADAITALRAALAQQAESPCACWPGRMCSRQAQCAATVRAQQAEPVAVTHKHEWFSTGGMEPGQSRCIHCGVWAKE